jgi:hypothetical protein
VCSLDGVSFLRNGATLQGDELRMRAHIKCRAVLDVCVGVLLAAMSASCDANFNDPRPHLTEIWRRRDEVALEIGGVHGLEPIELLFYAGASGRLAAIQSVKAANAAEGTRAVVRFPTQGWNEPFAFGLQIDGQRSEFLSIEGTLLTNEGPFATQVAQTLHGGWRPDGDWLLARSERTPKIWFAPPWPTLGAPNESDNTSTHVEHPNEASAACVWPTTPIGVIQGLRERSPFAGREVAVQGVVTAQVENNGVQGYFLQAQRKGAETGSDAIFVTTNAVEAVGQALCIFGTVHEEQEMTAITPLFSPLRLGIAALPAPIVLSADPLPQDWERFEGMRVQLPDTWTINDWMRGRAREKVRIGDDLSHRSCANDAQEGSAQPLLWLATPDLVERDGLTRLQTPGGLLGRGSSIGRLVAHPWPQNDGIDLFAATAIRGSAAVHPRLNPPHVGHVRIAFANLHNFFLTLGERGAQDIAEFERQRDRVVNMLLGLHAQVLAVAEVENDAGEHTLAALVDALNHAALRQGERGDFRFLPQSGKGGNDAIRNAVIVRGASFNVQTRELDFAENWQSRPPAVVQLCRDERCVEIVAIHGKSRLCAGAPPDDRDLGEGCFAAFRRSQVETLLAAGAADKSTLLLGDFNAIPCEGAMTPLRRAGWREVLAGFSAWTYVFAEKTWLFDQIWSSPSFDFPISQSGIWSINANLDPVFSPSMCASCYELLATPYRASDHDPIYVDIDLGVAN